MKPIAFVALFVIAFAGCRKNESSQPAPDLTPPNPVCTAPAPADVSGAKLWGDGTPGSCTQQALQNLLNEGGKIRCNCGPNPHAYPQCHPYRSQ